MTLEERFWAKVDRRGPNDCWPWMAVRDANGYGRIWVLELHRQDTAHRVSYRMAHGSIPEGFDVHHRCDNPPCVNPRHLGAVSHRENCQRRKTPTHCPQGHPYDEANTHYRPQNKALVCRASGRERAQARRDRKKAEAA